MRVRSGGITFMGILTLQSNLRISTSQTTLGGSNFQSSKGCNLRVKHGEFSDPVGPHLGSSSLMAWLVMILLPLPQFFFFSFIFISWRLITLQYCSGFCHTLTWISHGFTCIPHPSEHLLRFSYLAVSPARDNRLITTWNGIFVHLSLFSP